MKKLKKVCWFSTILNGIVNQFIQGNEEISFRAVAIKDREEERIRSLQQ